MKHISWREFMADLQDSARKLDFPGCGSFELTPLCNLDCKMCYVHLQDPSVKDRMLNADQWISIMEAAIRKGMVAALLTGGEALTHPEFRKIYAFLIHNGIAPRLKSNGILLNHENLDFLKKYPPYMLDISLYGCNSESYVAVTGHDVFAVVRDNIRAAIDAGFCVRLMITPNKYMQPWIEEVMQFAKSFNAAMVGVNALLTDAREETGRSKDEFDISLAENVEIMEKKRNIFTREMMLQAENDQLNAQRETPPDVPECGLYCNGGKTAFSVHWDGTMLPCLDFSPDILSAYPLRVGFDAAWQTINQGIRQYTVPQKCRTCSINTQCHYCPAQHGKFASKHQCDEKICTFWHKIYDKDMEK